MATLRISPLGEYEVGIGEDDDGATYVMIDLPDTRTGDRVELVFMLPAFVTFADWIAMIATELVDEAQHRKPPP